MPKSEKASRYTGFGILALGLILLILVFLFAYAEYREITLPTAETSTDILTWLIEWGIYIIMKLAFLGVMGWVGSIITLRGISLITRSTEEV